ncbi:hypothetical protein HDV00_012222 [Rhizophlyctis rosea]|nr:hypothetical protein HDV00_012222 [Rhizophlyctis rosea]
MAQISPTQFILYGGGQLDDNRPFFDDLWAMECDSVKEGWEYFLINAQDDTSGYGRPQPLWGATLTQLGSVLLLFGGQTGTTTWTNDLWSLPLPPPHTPLKSWTPTWTKLYSTGDTPFGRHGHTMTPFCQTSALLHGGWGDPTPLPEEDKDMPLPKHPRTDIQTSTTYILTLTSPITATWTQTLLSETLPPRCGHVATYIPSHASVLIHGGRSEDYTFLNDTWLIKVGVEPLRDLCVRRVRGLRDEGRIAREALVELGLVEVDGDG